MANLAWFRNERIVGRLKDIPLLETILRAKDFVATGLRYKIIAVLDLMQIQHSMPLDYSLTTAELYKQSRYTSSSRNWVGIWFITLGSAAQGCPVSTCRAVFLTGQHKLYAPQ